MNCLLLFTIIYYFFFVKILYGVFSKINKDNFLWKHFVIFVLCNGDFWKRNERENIYSERSFLSFFWENENSKNKIILIFLLISILKIMVPLFFVSFVFKINDIFKNRFYVLQYFVFLIFIYQNASLNFYQIIWLKMIKSIF